METIKHQAKSQRKQGIPNLSEDEARAHIEAVRWPNGPVCPHCHGANVQRLQGKSTRPGLLACRDCRGHFTVTVGTVMEDSHLSLSVWVRAFHLMSTSKKGMSALQLQRNLGLGSYKTAWHLAHRIREAMRCEPVAGLLKGEVQVDETYCGPDRDGKHLEPGRKPRKRGRGTDKTPILALVETGGKMHSRPIENVDGANIGPVMREVIDPSARIVTDELRVYPKVAAEFSGGHVRVNHNEGQYVDAGGFNTNSAESYFALLKRGIHGTFHHISRKHSHRYCDEFGFRWNGRNLRDVQRRDVAIAGAEGKRLIFKSPLENKASVI
jgi:transposase-like protein